ncbi:MAG: pilus assembly protein PilM [Zoogloeaceae bacterium]|jgi:type IV pilus assembly protein PilM|nr:pilus assembly protein PilM [Zoogloeaceae bacterium]
MDLSIFNPKNRPLLGLDISSLSVKMVELSETSKGGYRVEGYAIEALPHDAVVEGNIANLDAVADAVKRARKLMGSSAKYVAMALPAAAVITKKIILPGELSERELEVQVESEANRSIPFALDEVNLDFQIIGPAPANPDEIEVLIAASRKEKVEDRVAVAEAAGLRPLIMDIETNAAQATLELLESRLPGGGKNQTVAFIDIGANVTSVMMLRNGQPVYTREQAFGGNRLTQDITRRYGMSREEAEAAKRTGNLPENFQNDLLKPFLSNLAQEVSRALQLFFTSTQYGQVDRIVLAGGCAVIPGIDAVVSGATRIDTAVANPFAGMSVSLGVSRRLSVDAPSLVVACGLALRRFEQ